MKNNSSMTNQGSKKLDLAVVKSAVLILRSVNHPLRQQILQLINDNKRINVSDIYIKLRLEQSVASLHLSILRRAHMVITQREGQVIYYSINPASITKVALFVDHLSHYTSET